MKITFQTLIAILLLLPGFLSAENVKTVIIYFAKNKPYFTNGEAQKLAVLKSADYVQLKGYADNDGAPDFNLDLSAKRVETVKAYIKSIDAGINVESAFYGSRGSLNKNASEQQKSFNRRVEINYICDPLLRVAPPQQHYEIDNTQNQVITCFNGTQVVIPAGAFANKKVTIKVTEFNNPMSILATNLSTKSDRAPIETAGMINITAEADGQSILPSAPLQYKFPRKNKSDDFGLFTGIQDTSLNVNWKPTKTEPAKTVSNKAIGSTKIYSTQLLGWDTSEDLATAAYSAYLQGSGIDSFWWHRNNAARKLQEGCLANGTAELTVNSKGQLTGIQTSFEGKNTGWDNDLRTFIKSYFPKDIDTKGSGARVFLKFGKYNTASIVTGEADVLAAGGFNFWQSFGKEYVADYETDKIILNTTKMGWINCDRFMSCAAFTDYKVQTDPNANVRLMMKKYNAFFANEYRGKEGLNHLENKTEYGFYRIPANEDVVLISTKKIDNIIYLAIENTKISDTPFTDFHYKPVTEDELKSALAKL